MRAWLLTWTTYGSWLPGDRRGSVTRMREVPGPRRLHNIPGTPYDGPLPELESVAQAALNGSPIFLTLPQAERITTQFRETAAYRGWRLLASAVMRNHVHLVVVANEEVTSADLLRTFKSYASRALNAAWARPAGGRWWTTSASRRSLKDARAVEAAVKYVREQPGALVVSIAERGED
jgi:REP element-mobilizing transposase RayT